MTGPSVEQIFAGLGGAKEINRKNSEGRKEHIMHSHTVGGQPSVDHMGDKCGMFCGVFHEAA